MHESHIKNAERAIWYEENVKPLVDELTAFSGDLTEEQSTRFAWLEAEIARRTEELMGL